VVDEFHGSLRIWRGRTPSGLQLAGDGCGEAFAFQHAVLCVKLCDATALAFQPLEVWDKPKINALPGI
jgi:hypothetical protein